MYNGIYVKKKHENDNKNEIPTTYQLPKCNRLVLFDIIIKYYGST